MSSVEGSASERPASGLDGLAWLATCVGVGALGKALASVLESSDFHRETVAQWLGSVGGWFDLAVESAFIVCAGLLVLAVVRDCTHRTAGFIGLAVVGVVGISANAAGIVGALLIGASEHLRGLPGQQAGVILDRVAGVVLGCAVVLIAVTGRVVGGRRVSQGGSP